MKRFAFTLQVLLDVKETRKRQKEQELSAAERRLAALQEERQRLLGAREDNEQAWRAALAGSVSPSELNGYSGYFQELKDRLEEQEKQIREAEQRRDALRKELVLLLREIETLEDLREEQRQAFLKELAAEEEKELGDLMSYQSAAGGETSTGKD